MDMINQIPTKEGNGITSMTTKMQKCYELLVLYSPFDNELDGKKTKESPIILFIYEVGPGNGFKKEALGIRV
jgi:hypothetical protein